jgi:ABC-type dipeptide/oligopeptide/nickel transport system permease subunit
VVVLALLAPLVVRHGNHHPPNALYTRQALDPEFGTPKGPNGRFWLGADPSGRDLATRVLYGTRTSLVVSLVATAVSVALGTLTGLVAGYFRGLLALVLAASCGGSAGCAGGLIRPGTSLVILVIALANWPYLGRLVRGQVLSLREKEFVEAAHMIGAGSVWVMRSEILPNLLAPVIVYATVALPTNVLFEAALSFLGIGVHPPDPSLGQMIADSTATFTTAWWYFVFPGLFLLATVLAFNLVGDGLRDSLLPHQSRIR